MRLFRMSPPRTPLTFSRTSEAATSEETPRLNSIVMTETPSWELDKTITPSPHHPFGAKGVGESATVGAPPAIVNAVVDALAHLGVKHVEIPITPEKVWKILKEKGVAE